MDQNQYRHRPKGYCPINKAQEDQVGFLADIISYDDLNQNIVAEGSVEITQNDKIVRANKVIYNLQAETVEAVGDVAMMDASGDVHFADRVELEKKFSKGYIKKLHSVLADGSRITAEEGRRIDRNIIVMKDASYTPCEPCKAHPEKSPCGKSQPIQSRMINRIILSPMKMQSWKSMVYLWLTHHTFHTLMGRSSKRAVFFHRNFRSIPDWVWGYITILLGDLSIGRRNNWRTSLLPDHPTASGAISQAL